MVGNLWKVRAAVAPDGGDVQPCWLGRLIKSIVICRNLDGVLNWMIQVRIFCKDKVQKLYNHYLARFSIMEQSLTAFLLLDVTLISISGVMAPGPMTAATLSLGTQRRHAGAAMAVGHGIVEFPLMFVMVVGFGWLFKLQSFRIGVGLVGGLALIGLALMMLLSQSKASVPTTSPQHGKAVWRGIVLSAGNPYFLLWWATIGLALLSDAAAFGVLAIVLCAIVHWLCDLFWLEVLSNVSFAGAKIMGPKSQKWITVICALVMAVFGVMFTHDALRQWI